MSGKMLLILKASYSKILFHDRLKEIALQKVVVFLIIGNFTKGKFIE